MNFYNIVELEEILDDADSYFHNKNEEYECCNNYSPKVIDFYRPYYKVYKKEKYWDNPNDKFDCNSNDAYYTIRETLFYNKLPDGILNWIYNHCDDEADDYSVLTKDLLQELLALCNKIDGDTTIAKAIFPSTYDYYDNMYFKNLSKLKTVLPLIIAETDFDKFEVICNIL